MNPMNPIKAHLLNALRPEQTVTTTAQLTIEEAYELGQRAHSAGLRFTIGMGAIYRGLDGELHEDTVVGVKEPGDDIYDPEATLFSELTCNAEPNPVSAFSDTVPDLRDPGTKGHAVAQLRGRAGDPFLSTRATEHFGLDVARSVLWEVVSEESDLTMQHEHLTEEEAIVAALEATKETP